MNESTPRPQLFVHFGGVISLCRSQEEWDKKLKQEEMVVWIFIGSLTLLPLFFILLGIILKGVK